MINYREQHVQMGLGVKPGYVARLLHKRLQKFVDWQVLAEFDWGDVGYDYEEGIRFAVLMDPKAICDAVRWAEKALYEIGADPKVLPPVQGKFQFAWLSASLSQHSRDKSEENNLFAALGWKHFKEDWRGWYWDFASPSIINCTTDPNQNNVSVGGPKVDESTNTNPTAGNDTVSDPAPATATPAPAPTPVVATETQPTAPTSTRAKSVKGAMKLARDMKAAGKSREEVSAAVAKLYLDGGRTEKDAKYFGSGTVWAVFGPVNPRKAPEPKAETPAAAPTETTPQTNA